MKRANERIGTAQIRSMEKLIAFTQRPDIYSRNTADIRIRCIDHWELKNIGSIDSARLKRLPSDPEELFQTLFSRSVDRSAMWKGNGTRALAANHIHGEKPLLRKHAHWRCCPSNGSGTTSIVIAFKGETWYLNPVENKWLKIDGLRIAHGTALIAEVVISNTRAMTLEIIDAAVLGRENIERESFNNRRALIKKFLRAHSFEGTYLPITVKPVVELVHLKHAIGTRGSFIFPILRNRALPEPHGDWTLQVVEQRRFFVNKHDPRKKIKYNDVIDANMEFKHTLATTFQCPKAAQNREEASIQQLLAFVER